MAKVINDINLLLPDFKIIVIKIISLISELNYNFKVFETFRTQETQQEYFKRGVTKCDGIIKKSPHQLNKAVDFVYWTGNNWSWDYVKFPYISFGYEVLKQFEDKIKWGGVWSDVKANNETLESFTAKVNQRIKDKKFVDMPHYEKRG